MLNMANERMEHKREEASSSLKDDNEDDDEDDNDEDDNDDDSTTMKDDSDNNSKRKRKQRNIELPTGDLLHHDMGTGLPFRPATFDACISISALQWLCYANTRDQIPKRRLLRFFSSLYTVLRRGARAVLQFYPETAEHAILISECAAKVGFAGGIVVDYPNSTKAKKHYLVLSFERAYKAPPGLITGSDGSSTARMGVASGGGVRVADNDNSRAVGSGGGGKRGTEKNMIPRKKKGGGKTKEWIVHKKETQRKKGKDTRKDTKYTGRKRPMRF
jgi:18S rRNA (guanine1575-N7)-methyltransferase